MGDKFDSVMREATMVISKRLQGDMSCGYIEPAVDLIALLNTKPLGQENPAKAEFFYDGAKFERVDSATESRLVNANASRQRRETSGALAFLSIPFPYVYTWMFDKAKRLDKETNQRISKISVDHPDYEKARLYFIYAEKHKISDNEWHDLTIATVPVDMFSQAMVIFDACPPSQSPTHFLYFESNVRFLIPDITRVTPAMFDNASLFSLRTLRVFIRKQFESNVQFFRNFFGLKPKTLSLKYGNNKPVSIRTMQEKLSRGDLSLDNITAMREILGLNTLDRTRLYLLLYEPKLSDMPIVPTIRQTTNIHGECVPVDTHDSNFVALYEKYIAK